MQIGCLSSVVQKWRLPTVFRLKILASALEESSYNNHQQPVRWTMDLWYICECNHSNWIWSLRLTPWKYDTGRNFGRAITSKILAFTFGHCNQSTYRLVVDSTTGRTSWFDRHGVFHRIFVFIISCHHHLHDRYSLVIQVVIATVV